jgi:hypothetical protein
LDVWPQARADLAKESAKLRSLKAKQQLGVQARSIANPSTHSVLSLFRKAALSLDAATTRLAPQWPAAY